MTRNTFMIEPLVLLLFVAMTGCGGNEMPQFQGGDIIFQESRSSQSEALRFAMHSPYTHMGVIFIDRHDSVVYEAVGPVKYTPLRKWVQQGAGGHCVVKRLSNAGRYLAGDGIDKLKAAGESYIGRPYDFLFSWSDERIYCSELVWKMYEAAFGIEIGALQTFSDFDLSDPAVVKVIKERFPNGIPEDEVLISPAGIFNSELLTTVYEQ